MRTSPSSYVARTSPSEIVACGHAMRAPPESPCSTRCLKNPTGIDTVAVESFRAWVYPERSNHCSPNCFKEATMSESAIVGGPSLPQERKLVTAIPGPKSQELLARKNGAVASGVGVTLPVFTAAAGGGVLVDIDGNSLIDLGSGIAVTAVGNSAPRVVEAVTDQISRFTHTCFTVTPYENYIQVAEKLNELTPGDFEKRSALFNSGAEAVENAIKIARHYTKKNAVVVFDHAFHGRTNLTMAMTSKNMPYKEHFGPFAPEIYRAP